MSVCVNSSSYRHILSTSEAATGVAQIWVEEEDGINSIVIIPGANLLLTPQEVRQAEATIAACKVLVVRISLAGVVGVA